MLRWSLRCVNVSSWSCRRLPVSRPTECFYAQCNTLYTYRGTHEPLDDPRCAKDFVLSLKSTERAMLYKNLDEVIQQSKVQVDEAPTSAILRKILLNNLIPFIGFGFLDNLIMIVAGDFIDVKIGAILGITTLAAAAWGNLISDVFGLALAGYIESFSAKLGLSTPDISPKQCDMMVTKVFAALGRTIGIILGCLLGMVPLFFISTEDYNGHSKELN